MHQYNFEIIGSQKYNWYMDRNMLVHTGEISLSVNYALKNLTSKNVTEIGYISYMYYYI